MVKKIIQLGDKTLKQKSEPVDPKKINSRETKQLIQDMLDTVTAEEDSGGLSAVQIGVLKRIYTINTTPFETEEELDEWEVLINPEVKVIGEQKSVAWEGCLSVGTGRDRLFGPVERHDHVEVSYLTPAGKKKSFKAHGFFAHVVQHEQDHLNGILFLKYVSNPENIWKNGDLDDYIEDNDELPEIIE